MGGPRERAGTEEGPKSAQLFARPTSAQKKGQRNYRCWPAAEIPLGQGWRQDRGGGAGPGRGRGRELGGV